MQVQTFGDRHRRTSPPARTAPRARPNLAAPLLQALPIGTALFRPGEERTLYCVETGAISHFIAWPNGRHEVVEFAFPGDVIGLGYLEHHVSSAHAMVDSVVSIMTQTDLDRMLVSDDVLALRLTSAIEREFDYLREAAVRRANPTPVARLASYLVALALMDQRPSDGACFIADANASPHAAELLGMDFDTMAVALARLYKLALVAPAKSGLVIPDVAALERFADAGEIFG